MFRSRDQYTSNNYASIQDIGKIEKGEFLLFGKLISLAMSHGCTGPRYLNRSISLRILNFENPIAPEIVDIPDFRKKNYTGSSFVLQWNCVCKLCQVDYGSCSTFQEYVLNSNEIHQVVLRSGTDVSFEEDDEDFTDMDDFIVEGSIVAVVADEKSEDSAWFIKVLKTNPSLDKEVTDDYENREPAGSCFIKGHFTKELVKREWDKYSKSVQK